MFCVQDGLSRYKVVLEPPIQFPPGASHHDSQISGIREYAKLLEAYVRRYPQYWHRWSRPPVPLGGDSIVEDVPGKCDEEEQAR